MLRYGVDEQRTIAGIAAVFYMPLAVGQLFQRPTGTNSLTLTVQRQL